MGHVIVCGLGQLGYRIANLLLQLKCEVVIVTQDTRQEFLDLITAAGATIVHGDARADHVLAQARLNEARALIACVDDDVTNIEVALDAKRLNPSLRIVARLFDQTLARRLETTVGINRALGMSVLAAPAFAASAFGGSVFGSFVLDGNAYVATKVRHGEVPAGTIEECGCEDEEVEAIVPFHEFVREAVEGGRHVRRPFKESLREVVEGAKSVWVNMPKFLRMLVLVILSLAFISVFVFQIGMGLSPIDAVYFVVTTLTTTGYGDISLHQEAVWLKVYGCFLMLMGSASVAALYSTITDFIVTARFDQLLGRQSVGLEDHVVVVGLGNVGFRTTETLVAMGAKVATVELDPEAPYRRFLDKKVAFTAGDGRDVDTLDRAAVRSAKAVIVATQNDAVNLSVGLAARTLNERARIIVRIFDADFASKVEDVMTIDSALSATRIAAPGFVGATLFPDALLCYVDGNRFCAVLKDEAGRLSITSHVLAPNAGRVF